MTRIDRNRLSRRGLLEIATVAGLGAAAVAGRETRADEPATPLGSPLSAASPAVATPANVRVSHDDFAQHAETAIAANPRDGRNLLAACIVEGSDTSHIATYVSFDAGVAWRSNGALPGSDDGRDPTVAFDGAGHGFVGANASGVSVWRNDDGGRRFGDPVVITSEHTDHPWLAVDPVSGHLFVAFSLGRPLLDLGFSRSTDGGRSFSSPRSIVHVTGNVVADAMAAAGAGGTVAVAYGIWPTTTLPTGGKTKRSEITGPIRVAVSTDGGETFGQPVELGTGAMEVELTDDADSTALPAIAVPPDGKTLFAVFVRRPAATDATEIVIAVSRDRGQTWSAPVPVTPASAGIQYFQPQLAVDPAGRIAVSAFATTAGQVDVMLFLAAPGTLSFSGPIRVTSQAFDPAQGTPSGGAKHGAWWIGDYQGLTTTADAVHLFWNDTRTGQLEVFTATVPSQLSTTIGYRPAGSELPAAARRSSEPARCA